MNCQQAPQHITAYLSGELEPEQARELEQRLAECPQCQAELALTRTVVTALRQVPREPMPAELQQRIRERVAELAESEVHAGSRVSTPTKPELGPEVRAAGKGVGGLAGWWARKRANEPTNQRAGETSRQTQGQRWFRLRAQPWPLTAAAVGFVLLIIGIIGIPWSSRPTITPAALAEQMEQAWTNIHDYYRRMVTIYADGRTIEQEMWMKAPDKYKTLTREPGRTWIEIINGRQTVVHYPEQGIVVIHPTAQALLDILSHGGAREELCFRGVLTNPQAEITGVETIQGQRCWVVRSGNTRAIWLGQDNTMLMRAETRSPEGRLLETMETVALVRNQGIDEAVFDIDIPPKAKVIKGVIRVPPDRNRDHLTRSRVEFEQDLARAAPAQPLLQPGYIPEGYGYFNPFIWHRFEFLAPKTGDTLIIAMDTQLEPPTGGEKIKIGDSPATLVSHNVPYPYQELYLKRDGLAVKITATGLDRAELVRVAEKLEPIPQTNPPQTGPRANKSTKRPPSNAAPPSDELLRLRKDAEVAFGKGDFKRALSLFQQYLQGQPDDYPARLRIADCYVRLGRDDEATSFYQEMIEATSASTPSGEAFSVQARLSLAALYWRKGRLDEAAQLYDQVRRSGNPLRLQATTARANLYVQQGQPEQAIRICRELAQESPQFAPVVHGHIGKIFEQQGKYTEALAEYQQAAEQNRAAAGSWLLRVAEIYDARLHQPQQAAQTWQQVVRDWPGTPTALQAMEKLGDLARRNPRTQAQVRQWYERALLDFDPFGPLAAPAREKLLSLVGQDQVELTLPHDRTILFDAGPIMRMGAEQQEWLLFLRRAGYRTHFRAGQGRSFAPEVLAHYRVMILPPWYFMAEAPTAEEQKALAAYVQRGGGLLILTGGRVSPEMEKAVNSLTARFGIEQVPGSVLERDQKVTDLTPHPALGKMPFFFLCRGAELTVSGKAQVLARCDGKPVLAAAEFGKGRVVVAALGTGLTRREFVVPPSPQEGRTAPRPEQEWAEQNPKLLLSLVKWAGARAKVERKIIIQREDNNNPTRGPAHALSVEPEAAPGGTIDADNHEGVLPSSATWCDAILPYVKDKQVFVCPSAPNRPCGYAYNDAYSGKKWAQIPDMDRAVILYDSNQSAWNAHDAGTSLPQEGRHEEQVNVGYANGNIQALPVAQAQQLLRP